MRKDLGSRARKDLYKSLRKLSAAKLWEETARNSTGSRRSPPASSRWPSCAPSASSSPTPTTRASRRRRRGSSSCSPTNLRKFGGMLRPQHQESAAATPTSCCCRCCARALRCASARARRRRWPMLARTTPLRPRWRSWRARPTLYTSGPSRRCATRARSQRRRLARRVIAAVHQATCFDVRAQLHRHASSPRTRSPISTRRRVMTFAHTLVPLAVAIPLALLRRRRARQRGVVPAAARAVVARRSAEASAPRAARRAWRDAELASTMAAAARRSASELTKAYPRLDRRPPAASGRAMASPTVRAEQGRRRAPGREAGTPAQVQREAMVEPATARSSLGAVAASCVIMDASAKMGRRRRPRGDLPTSASRFSEPIAFMRQRLEFYAQRSNWYRVAPTARASRARGVPTVRRRRRRPPAPASARNARLSLGRRRRGRRAAAPPASRCTGKLRVVHLLDAGPRGLRPRRRSSRQQRRTQEAKGRRVDPQRPPARRRRAPPARRRDRAANLLGRRPESAGARRADDERAAAAGSTTSRTCGVRAKLRRSGSAATSLLRPRSGGGADAQVAPPPPSTPRP